MHPITAAIQTSPTIIQLPISSHPTFFSGPSFSIASLALSTSTLPFTTRRLSLSKCFRFSTVSSINLFCSSLTLFTSFVLILKQLYVDIKLLSSIVLLIISTFSIVHSSTVCYNMFIAKGGAK